MSADTDCTGSSTLNIGVAQLMDLIVHGLPSPCERETPSGTNQAART
jgi:translation elongation factor EF-G